jgi:hypothetical protein
VHARIFEQPGFGRKQLLEAETRSGSVLVFVVPEVDGSVRLYFRAPDGERFLLRNVMLRAGFDEIGREQVGLVVETAVVSLLDSGDGLTREQALVALTRADPAPAPPMLAKAATPPQRTRPRAPAKAASPRPTAANAPTALEGWLGLRYGAVAFGPELGVGHGPGLELGLGVKRRFLLRGRATFERHLGQSLGTSLIAAELTRTRLLFAADAGLPLSQLQLLLVSLGVGQERLEVKPAAQTGSSVVPAPAFRDQAPIVHAELRYEATFGRFRVATAAGVDVALVDTHYDVTRSTGRESVVRPWLVRPNASLALAFCPSWAIF